MDNPNYVLYRFYDEAGTLLYIGQSMSVWNRLQKHREQSQFFPHAAAVTFQRGFTTKDELDAAEMRAIANEKPQHNINGLRPRGPYNTRKKRNESKDADKALWSRTAVKKNGCWQWQGASFVFMCEGQSWAPHRYTYAKKHGPTDHQLIRLCDTDCCINPDHHTPKVPGFKKAQQRHAN